MIFRRTAKRLGKFFLKCKEVAVRELMENIFEVSGADETIIISIPEAFSEAQTQRIERECKFYKYPTFTGRRKTDGRIRHVYLTSQRNIMDSCYDVKKEEYYIFWGEDYNKIKTIISSV